MPESRWAGSGAGRLMTTRMEERRELFAGALEMMVLETRKRQPVHGYALEQPIKRGSDQLPQVEEGSLSAAARRPP